MNEIVISILFVKVNVISFPAIKEGEEAEEAPRPKAKRIGANTHTHRQAGFLIHSSWASYLLRILIKIKDPLQYLF